MKYLILGLKRHSLRFLVSVFLSYSAIWTIIESVSFFNPTLDLKGIYYQSFSILVSFLIGVYRIYQPKKISIKINTSDTTLKVYFGDIFSCTGFKAIPVNEYFDSEIGEPVSPNSLHGMLIKRYFGGHSLAFEQIVDKSLQDSPLSEGNRKEGRNRCYPIGTTALIEANDNQFLLFALTHTELKTYKAYADIPELLESLGGLFTKARNCTGGSILLLPLAGSGLSGIGLPATQLLQLIILVIINETKKRQICKQIDIVLHESRLDEIDLEMIKKQWS